MTPEGKVKARVKAILKPYIARRIMWVDWPVPAGYGKSTLDCIGCIHGMFFAIETKAPGKRPTERQELCMRDMRDAGAYVFVTEGRPEELAEITSFLEGITGDKLSSEREA